MKPHQKVLLSYLKEHRLCYIDWLTSTGTIETTKKYIESLDYKNVLVVTKRVNSIIKHFSDIENDTIEITYLPTSVLKLDTFKPIIKEYDVIIFINFIYEVELIKIDELVSIVNEMNEDTRFIMFAHDDRELLSDIYKLDKFFVSDIQKLDQLKELDLQYDRYLKLKKLKNKHK